MSNKEQLEQVKLYNCDLCAKTDKKDRIVGGRFCVKLSGYPDNREVFEELLKPAGLARFGSYQCREDIVDCVILQWWSAVTQLLSEKPDKELVLEGV